MAGRPIPDDDDLLTPGYVPPEVIRRRAILKETLDAFLTADPPDRYHLLAADNLSRWKRTRETTRPEPVVQVFPGDWGEVTHALTKSRGVCFAALNMANAYVPGGGYVEGAVAQEENMFRRTDCHFRIGDDEYDAARDRYLPEMTRLLSAEDGLVYLDTEQPRVCIRGPEVRDRENLGYDWLPEDEVFPFFELRASAQDLRGGRRFDRDEARRRIAAQLDTLRQNRIRYAVLGAFGCGAFQNPADQVARLYRDEINRRLGDFTLIAFAIFAAGYGPDNYGAFAEVFGGQGKADSG